MNSVDLNTIKKVHFVGIGGIGVSALARMMLHQGKGVTGSDNSPSEITEDLQKLGATISIGHSAGHISPDTNLVVYTAAIPKENPELTEARNKKILTLSYSEMLGMVSKGKKVIAVAGTHGKTTTTAMLAEILMKGGIDPTVVVGSLLLPSRTNFVAGDSEYFLTEADEYKKSFLSLSPFGLVITNIDLDHLDFYKDLSDIQNAFGELVEKIPKEGFLVCNTNHLHLLPVIKRAQCKVLDYTSLSDLRLKVPGKHNLENAKAALLASTTLGVENLIAVKALEEFVGTWRRFELKGETKSGALIYDDYAHNPHKVAAALAGAREQFEDRKIVAVFQPHLYSRTKLLLKEFSKAFVDADVVLLSPIYAAREVFDPSISSEMLAEEIRKTGKDATAFTNFSLIRENLLSTLKKGDVCLLLGAGDIYDLGQDLVA